MTNCGHSSSSATEEIPEIIAPLPMRAAAVWDVVVVAGGVNKRRDRDDDNGSPGCLDDRGEIISLFLQSLIVVTTFRTHFHLFLPHGALCLAV